MRAHSFHSITKREKAEHIEAQKLMSQNPKNTKYRVHTKQRNGGTKNKHCNLLIYTVPFNRVLSVPRYYNIQTIKYHNNAELIFLQHISRRCQPTLKLRKTQKFTFLKIQKTQNTGYTYKTTKRGNQK